MHDVEDERNWVEDYQHENGRYQCRCTACKHKFIGHKRRVICKLCADPTPVQGEPLPVVAKVVDTDITGARIVRVMRPVDIGMQLTDHAQATAEIAKRDAVIEFHSKTLERIARQDIPALQTELTTLRTQLSTALAESGEMRDSDDLRLGREIQRAARILPDGFEVVISVENGAGTVKMFDAEGNGLDIEPDYDGFSYHVTAAIDAALARPTTTQESADND